MVGKGMAEELSGKGLFGTVTEKPCCSKAALKGCPHEHEKHKKHCKN